jgi:hypothetical protein
LHRLEEYAFAGRDLIAIHIPASLEVLCRSCVCDCKLLASVTFESNVKLHGIEEYAFQADNVAAINIPVLVEVLCKFCFSDCQLFTSITFESNSKLHQIEGSAFAGSGLTTSSIPAFVEMLSKSAFLIASHLHRLHLNRTRNRAKLRRILLHDHRVCIRVNIRHHSANGLGRSLRRVLARLCRRLLTKTDCLDKIHKHPKSSYDHEYGIRRHCPRRAPNDWNVRSSPTIPLRASHSHRDWNAQWAFLESVGIRCWYGVPRTLNRGKCWSSATADFSFWLSALFGASLAMDCATAVDVIAATQRSFKISSMLFTSTALHSLIVR